MPKVLFYLHELSDSLYRTTAKKHKLDVTKVELSNETISSLVRRFGFPDIQEEIKQDSLYSSINYGFKWHQVPFDCLYGRIDNRQQNYHRLDLASVPQGEEHMAKIMKYAPGVSFVFQTDAKTITFRYRMHYYQDTYNLPLKSGMEPIVLGLDKYGVWNMVNYIRVFTPKEERQIKPDMELQFSVGDV